MVFVVLLKGINVGGRRTFRPSELAKEPRNLDVVNVGGAGTFVVRNAASREKLRAEIARRLPFKAEIMICSGREVLRLIASDPFAGQTARAGIVRFVGVMARSRKPSELPPLDLPSSGRWFVRVLARQGRFVAGLYRREMKTIGYLGRLEKIFGTPLTTRNWNTFLSIGQILRPAR
jgi:uncharacterized protein (DUF1697 family)